jgi:Fic family protein
MADMKAVLKADDQGERVSLMEPLSLSENSRCRPLLADLALELARKSAALKRSLPPCLIASLADLICQVNGSHTNQIEENDCESEAYQTVQNWIHDGALKDGRALTAEGLREIHRRYCEQLPDEMLWVTNHSTRDRFRMVPGQFRNWNVRVGAQLAISPGAVPRFLDRMADAYGKMGISESILTIPAVHHRLLWIHPFPDGNGRVARLMTHAMILDRLDSGGVWSIMRGIARRKSEYVALLSACDSARHHGFDGPGPLSEEALVEFTRFFLNLCLEQVNFMECLTQPDRLRTRIVLWAEEESRMGELPPKAGCVLAAILYRGILPRSEAAAAVGAGERQARRVISALTAKGVLVSESPRAPLRLAFPPDLASRWLPGLIPE